MAEQTDEIRTPWELVADARANGAIIDGYIIDRIYHHYPNTGIGTRGEGRSLVFVRAESIGAVSTNTGRIDIVLINRAIWFMLAPRGQPELLLLDKSNSILARGRYVHEARLEGTTLYTDISQLGVDLVSTQDLQHLLNCLYAEYDHYVDLDANGVIDRNDLKLLQSDDS